MTTDVGVFAAGGLAAHVDGYLTLRRALGYQLTHDEKLLHDYASYAEARGVHTVTVAMTAAWAERDPRNAPPVVSKRVSTVRLFAQYLQAFDPDCQPIPDRMLAATQARRTPFIFTGDQINELLQLTATMRSPLWAAGARTLFGLLAATGLRPGEAWRIDDSDLTLDPDTGRGLLLIRCSKWGRTRQIPLHATEQGDRQAAQRLAPATARAARRSGVPEQDRRGAVDRHRRAAAQPARHDRNSGLPVAGSQDDHPAHAAAHLRHEPAARRHRQQQHRALARPREHPQHPGLPARRHADEGSRPGPHSPARRQESPLPTKR